MEKIDITKKLNKLRLKIEQENDRHTKRMFDLKTQIERWQSLCEHQWFTRNIMGRDNIDECMICCKQR